MMNDYKKREFRDWVALVVKLLAIALLVIGYIIWSMAYIAVEVVAHLLYEISKLPGDVLRFVRGTFELMVEYFPRRKA